MITRNDPNARYWSTGIVLTWTPQARRGNDGTPIPGWSGSLDFRDDGWAGDDNPDTRMVSTEGTLRTRYTVADGREKTALAAVIDALLADAERLGIYFTGPDLRPRLCYRGDGEHPDYSPPDGWRDLLAAEAQRIGWVTYQRKEVGA